mgnify:CR=1 FL=1
MRRRDEGRVWDDPQRWAQGRHGEIKRCAQQEPIFLGASEEERGLTPYSSHEQISRSAEWWAQGSTR